MKIAIISDVHGNLAAFRTVWEKIKNYPLILNAGDLTGYYPDINPIISQVNSEKVKSVLGNHDRFLVVGKLPKNINAEIIKPYQNNLQNISFQNMAFLKGLKPAETFTIDGLKIGLYHSSPFCLDEYIYPDSPLERFKEMNFDILILGHTHWPMIKQIGKMTIINPGSVGQPRDYDNDASFAILDTETKTVEIKRIKYDILETVRKIEKLGYDTGLKDVLLRKR